MLSPAAASASFLIWTVSTDQKKPLGLGHGIWDMSQRPTAVVHAAHTLSWNTWSTDRKGSLFER